MKREAWPPLRSQVKAAIGLCRQSGANGSRGRHRLVNGARPRHRFGVRQVPDRPADGPGRAPLVEHRDEPRLRRGLAFLSVTRYVSADRVPTLVLIERRQRCAVLRPLVRGKRRLDVSRETHERSEVRRPRRPFVEPKTTWIHRWACSGSATATTSTCRESGPRTVEVDERPAMVPANAREPRLSPKELRPTHRALKREGIPSAASGPRNAAAGSREARGRAPTRRSRRTWAVANGASIAALAGPRCWHIRRLPAEVRMFHVKHLRAPEGRAPLTGRLSDLPGSILPPFASAIVPLPDKHPPHRMFHVKRVR